MKICRNNTIEEIVTICSFFIDPQELAYTYPFAKYPMDEYQLRNFMNGRSDFTTIINNISQVIAFASIYNIEMDSHCFLGNLIVHPDYRRMGLAKTIVNEIAKIAHSKYGAEYLKLNCWKDNTDGINFYRHMGFTTNKTITRYIVNRNVTVYELVKKI